MKRYLLVIFLLFSLFLTAQSEKPSWRWSGAKAQMHLMLSPVPQRLGFHDFRNFGLAQGNEMILPAQPFAALRNASSNRSDVGQTALLISFKREASEQKWTPQWLVGLLQTKHYLTATYEHRTSANDSLYFSSYTLNYLANAWGLEVGQVFSNAKKDQSGFMVGWGAQYSLSGTVNASEYYMQTTTDADGIGTAINLEQRSNGLRSQQWMLFVPFGLQLKLVDGLHFSLEGRLGARYIRSTSGSDFLLPLHGIGFGLSWSRF